MIKKVLICFSLIVFLSSFCTAITKSSSNTQEHKKVEKNAYYRDLQKAKNYYCEGNFVEAEKALDKIFEVSIDNEKATELRNKILLVKEKEAYYKKALVNDLVVELRRTIKEGNCYEGFLFVKKIEELSPEEPISAFRQRLENEKDLILYSIEDVSDRHLFLDSIDYFVKEKFEKSSDCIYKLYQKYPKFNYYVGMNRYYVLQETTTKRVKMYCDKAIKSFKATRLGEAKEYAELAYNLQPNNLKLRVLLEQINMDIL